MFLLADAPWLYALLRSAHLALAGLSVGLFCARGTGIVLGMTWPRLRAWRLASVGIDILLTLAGLCLWTLLQHNPLREPWLSAKLGLLAVYVVLGTCALKRARTRGSRLLYLAAALLCVFTLYSIARTRQPWGWMVSWA
ncbi:MAG: hypothetical protein RLZZ555_2222 [Pseudomonadota bacterium]|jgi:uncharacterized membrane protein SirB2